MEMGEVLLLAARYREPGARHAWAARLLWPALLRDLGAVPGGTLPVGAGASLASLRELAASPPQVRTRRCTELSASTQGQPSVQMRGL